MNRAPAGSTTAHPAVIPTRPAITPFSILSGCTQPLWKALISIQATPPADADKTVLTIIPGMALEASRVEPALKPIQPNQRIKTPPVAMTSEWPGISTGLPSSSNRPRLAPRHIAAARATQPPTLCTTVEPAKSIKPRWANQPSAFQIQ